MKATAAAGCWPTALDSWSVACVAMFLYMEKSPAKLANGVSTGGKVAAFSVPVAGYQVA